MVDPQWAGDGAYGGAEEGPAARAVRELELQLAAAEKDALRSVDYSTDNEVSVDREPRAGWRKLRISYFHICMQGCFRHAAT